jgi:hypothetical protein
MATNMLNTRTPAVDTTPRAAAYVEHNSERQLDLTLPSHAHARRRLSPGRSERASSRGYLPFARTDIFYLRPLSKLQRSVIGGADLQRSRPCSDVVAWPAKISRDTCMCLFSASSKERRSDGGKALRARASCGRPINISFSVQTNRYLYGAETGLLASFEAPS